MDWNKPKLFEVTEEHMKLLDRMYISYDDWTEFGAPEVDPKRPYGNSDVYDDIAEILGIEVAEDQWGDREFTDAQVDYMNKRHKEMETVLQILVRNARDGIRRGTYSTTDHLSVDWSRLGD